MLQPDPGNGSAAAPGKATAAEFNPTAKGTWPSVDAAEPIPSEAPRIGFVSDLDDIPAVAAYLRRVGAEPVNLCRARVVEQEHGYPRETGRIKFADDGGVTVNGTADRPSNEEADAITAAFKGVQFPKQVTLTAISTPPPGCEPDDVNSFVCHDFRGQIVMIQQRIDVADGTKMFRSWTRWSDGKWRNMEPEVMPFFGLPCAKDCSTLYIHEGAKAAKRVKRIISGNLQDTPFPWLEDMRHGAHIGWLGGVFALERSDWESLAKMNWSRVVIVADNDAKGKAIVPSIAKKFSCEVRALIFTDQWPARYDLGDECPLHLLKAPITPLLRPATWATVEHAPEEGQRRPTYSLASQFRSEWAYTVAPRFFFHREAPGRGLNEDEFNAFVAPYSQLKNTAAKLLACAEAQLHSLDYNPGCKPGEMAGERDRRWNTFEPSPVKPLKGDPAPSLDFMAHLIPDGGERREALRWVATLIARPDVRMRYSMLLISKRQGVGKSSVGNILGPLVGMSNVSIVNEQALVGSQFNGWALASVW